MKNILILSTILFSFNSWSANGAKLLAARDAAIEEASVELDLDTILAFEITPEGEEIEVAFKDANETHVFGCHFHGNDMACHEEGDDHKALKSEEGFEHIEEGHNAGLEKLEKTLRRRGSDLNALKSIKVWKLEDGTGDDGHEHGADVWTKVTYDMNEKEVTVFIQCHEHEDKSEEGFACHYKRKGKGEPEL